MAFDELHAGAIHQVWSAHGHAETTTSQRVVLLFALVVVTLLLVGVVIHRVARAEREEAQRHKER